jgi:hypothetical protein
VPVLLIIAKDIAETAIIRKVQLPFEDEVLSDLVGAVSSDFKQMLLLKILAKQGIIAK